MSVDDKDVYEFAKKVSELGIVDIPGPILAAMGRYEEYIRRMEEMQRGEKHLCPERAGMHAIRGVPEQDTWYMRDGARRCSFCGSVHPDDFEAALVTRIKEPGKVKLDGTDKSYKWYVEWPGMKWGKFYSWHIRDQQHLDRINKLFRGELPAGA